MNVEHDTLLWLSKSFGLFYLLGLSILTVAYAWWPSNRTRFDQAARSILHEEDRPWQ